VGGRAERELTARALFEGSADPTTNPPLARRAPYDACEADSTLQGVDVDIPEVDVSMIALQEDRAGLVVIMVEFHARRLLHLKIFDDRLAVHDNGHLVPDD